MGLHDGHRQRSKRRYLALGAEGLEDHQLLELLLLLLLLLLRRMQIWIPASG